MEILKRFVKKIARKGMLQWMTDEQYLKLLYRIYMGKKLHLENPVSFNEKMQWLKLYDRNPQYTIMVDKCAVKKYIAETIGPEYVIPMIAVWNNEKEINFGALPNKFVLKTTHDSGGIRIVDKTSTTYNEDELRDFFARRLSYDLYSQTKEWPYKNVPHRIMAEKYMREAEAEELKDYKFFCFNGKVTFFKVDFDRFKNHRANYYDLDMNMLPFGEKKCPYDSSKIIEKPLALDQMVKLAEKLSKGMPFVRVDFYYAREKIYFGELTFFPASGFGKFIPEFWDVKLGDLLNLPKA